jgi:hypothetical protein
MPLMHGHLPLRGESAGRRGRRRSGGHGVSEEGECAGWAVRGVGCGSNEFRLVSGASHRMRNISDAALALACPRKKAESAVSLGQLSVCF